MAPFLLVTKSSPPSGGSEKKNPGIGTGECVMEYRTKEAGVDSGGLVEGLTPSLNQNRKNKFGPDFFSVESQPNNNIIKIIPAGLLVVWSLVRPHNMLDCTNSKNA